MHRFVTTFVLLAAAELLCFASAAIYSAPAGTVEFDYKVTFIGVHGTSTDLAAEASFVPTGLSTASGKVTIKAASLKTGKSLQESHMRGAMGADQFPDIVFTLSKVNSSAALSEGQTLITTGSGTLSLKGVTRPLNVPLKLTLLRNTVKVATQFKFNPHFYGVNYFGGADSIDVNVGFLLAPR
jgi:polyisoprenoid-binding protein YceI